MANTPRSDYVVDGPKLRRMRDRAGYSGRQFALTLGTDPTHLSRIERGLTYPGAKLRNRMAEVLGVEIEDICKPVPALASVA